MLVLKTRATDEEVVGLLPRLQIVLSAYATEAVPSGTLNASSASGKHEVGSVTVPAAHPADVLASHGHTFIVWKLKLHLPYPRARLQRPAIYFTASVGPSPESLSASRVTTQEVLVPFESLPANILEPLNSSYGTGSAQKYIYLPEDRLTNVPTRPAKATDAPTPLRGASKRAFPVVPALFAKIKLSPLPKSVIISLHVETSQVIAGTFSLDNVAISVSDARVDWLNAVSWPQSSHAGDEIVLLYELTPCWPTAEQPHPKTGTVEISVLIEAQATLNHGSSIHLESKIQTGVDLTPKKEDRVVATWQRGPEGVMNHLTHYNNQQHLNSTILCAPGPTAGAVDGLGFKFSCPPTVQVGEDFDLAITCENASTRARYIVVEPTHSCHLPRQPRPAKRTMTSLASTAPPDNPTIVASIFHVPEVRPSEHAHRDEKEKSVSDNGNAAAFLEVAPGTSNEKYLRIKPLVAGFVNFGTFHIMDLDSKHVVWVKALPDVVALEPEINDRNDEVGDPRST